LGYGPVIDSLIASGRLDVLQVQGLPSDNQKPAEQQLLESGVLNTKDILEALSSVYAVPSVLLAEEEIDAEAVGLVPADMAMNCKVLPLRRLPDKIVLAMADPTDVVAEDFVRFVTGFDIERVAAMTYELEEEINKRFRPTTAAKTSEMFNALEELALQQEQKEKVASQMTGEQPEEENAEKEKEASNAAPVVKAVHSLLSEGVLQKASDIHFEPVSTGLRVRYRIDGHLREITELPRMVQPMVLSRIKLQSGMDISEKRKPQDGRTRLQVGDREIDFRVSSLPTFYGEKIVMRILDSKKAAVELEIMGWSDRDLAAFLDFIRMPQGAILITGPTGSGKTSTLYAALARIHQPNINIVTVEDPVEFQISGINQVQVNNKAGLTFASALRSILRQDPNVVMLGEIRDSETANIAFEAAMTGHLVLSTLHTNDAPSALSRLIHVGVPNYMVAASLVGVVAQRLVRKLCPDCRTQGPITPELKDILSRSGLRSLPEMTWYPGGCKACNNSGYKGRMGIFEVIRVTEQIKACIYRDASEQEVKEVARRQGMNTLLEDGLRKVEQGLTSIEEVLSVAPAGTESGDDDEAPVTASSNGGHGHGHGKGHKAAGHAAPSPGFAAPMIPQVFLLQLPNGTTLPLTPIQAGSGEAILQLPMIPGLTAAPPPGPPPPSPLAPAPRNGDGAHPAGDASWTPPRQEDGGGDTICVCGNMVPAGQPYCNICGNILEVAIKPKTPVARKTATTAPKASPGPKSSPAGSAPRPPGAAPRPPQPGSAVAAGTQPPASPRPSPPAAPPQSPASRPAPAEKQQRAQTAQATVAPSGSVQCECGSSNPPGQPFCIICGMSLPLD
jgi:type IV pilus assembly protein PilB